MSKKTPNQLKTASVLAYERKLNPSDALLHHGDWEERANHASWPGIVVREKSVRGTISNRLKKAVASDPAKLNAEVRKPNLQCVDAAALPATSDTLKVSFTLRVIGNVARPAACNDREYGAALERTIDTYLSEHGCIELARRYACNLANGRFLWRNRVGAGDVSVVIDTDSPGTHVFDGYERPLDDFSASHPGIDAVADIIAQGLSGGGFALLRVTAFVRLGHAQEVFPSQELVQDRQSTGKSKHLYSVDGIAGMHSQKIGNAIRSIDTWHASAEETGPIPVEPYGSVTNRGVAYRQPESKSDFYTLLDGWVLAGKVPPLEQQHFVVANLIRGGVFGEAGG